MIDLFFPANVQRERAPYLWFIFEKMISYSHYGAISLLAQVAKNNGIAVFFSTSSFSLKFEKKFLVVTNITVDDKGNRYVEDASSLSPRLLSLSNSPGPSGPGFFFGGISSNGLQESCRMLFPQS